MKSIILIMIFLMLQICFSQTGTIKGHIYDKNKNIDLYNANVFLVGKGIETKTDVNGNFEFDSLSIGVYNIIIVHINYPDSLLTGINLKENTTINLDIKYPPYCKFDVKNTSCPICHKSDEVIPIIYGHPSEKLKVKAQKGEIILGGCKILKCVPHWYCKRDKKQF